MNRTVVGRISVACLLLVAGCPKRDLGAEDLAALLADLDRGWEADALIRPSAPIGLDRQRVEADLDRITQGQLRWPDHPELAWREGRLLVSLGVMSGDPLETRRWWSRARSVTWRCASVGRSPTLRAVAQGDVGLQGPESCAVWAADSWTRWASTWDAEAVDVDLAPLNTWIARGALTARPPHSERWRASLERLKDAQTQGSTRLPESREPRAIHP